MRKTIQALFMIVAALLTVSPGQSEAATASTAPALIFHVPGVQCVRPLRPLGFVPQANKTPVLIVGGTAASEIIYTPLELRLMADKYETYFFQLHQNGLIDMRTNADYLAKCVAGVLGDTGKTKVHMIAHSQGGLVARSYMHRHGATKVESLISLAAPHEGTEVAAAATNQAGVSPEVQLKAVLGSLMLAPVALLTPLNEQALLLEQFSPGSSFLAELDNLPGNVHYTNFSTTNDVFIHPWQNGQMSDAVCKTGACNIVLQERCPTRILTDHILLASDAAVYSGIQDALEHKTIQLDCNRIL